MDRTRYSHLTEVRADEIDELGHVNNTVYLRYAEEVARAHSDALGLSLDAYKNLGVVPVVRRHLITYHRSAVLGDRIRVSTQVEAFRGARAGRKTRIELGHGPLLAEVETEWVWVRADNGRPTRVPGEILGAFGLTPEPRGGTP